MDDVINDQLYQLIVRTRYILIQFICAICIVPEVSQDNSMSANYADILYAHKRIGAGLHENITYILRDFINQ